MDTQTSLTPSTSPRGTPHESQVEAGPFRGLRDAAANVLERAVQLLEHGGRAARNSLKEAVAALRGEGADAGAGETLSEECREYRRPNVSADIQALVDLTRSQHIVEMAHEGAEYIEEEVREGRASQIDTAILYFRLADHLVSECIAHVAAGKTTNDNALIWGVTGSSPEPLKEILESRLNASPSGLLGLKDKFPPSGERWQGRPNILFLAPYINDWL